MRIRVLAAIALVAALLFWLLWGGDDAHRSRKRDDGAVSQPPPARMEEADRASDGTPDGEAGAAADDDPPESKRVEKRLFQGRVQVLGREDMPVEGVHLRSDPPGFVFARATDAMGWTEWEAHAVSIDGFAIVDGLFEREHPLETPITTIRYPDLIPLDVEFIDANTGVVLEDGGVALPGGVAKTVHGRTARSLLIAPIEAGRTCDFKLVLDPPEGATGGHGLEEPVRAMVSGRAHSAHLRVPVWPEYQLTLEFQDGDGVLLAGVELDKVELAGRPIEVRSPRSDPAGRTQVFGIPYVAGAMVTLHVRGRSHSLRMSRNSEFSTLVVYSRRASRGAIQRGVAGRIDSPRRIESTSSASLEVEVRWFDATAANDTRVMVGIPRKEVRWIQTDAEGKAVFEQLPLGSVRVVALDPALAYDERRIPIEKERKYACVLGPGVGRSVTFVVQRGEPLAGARVTATAWFGELAPPFKDGVQELAAITGPGGELAWHGFPSGAVQIEATREQWTGRISVPEGVGAERRPIPLTMYVR